MRSKRYIICLGILLVTLFTSQSPIKALTISEAVDAVASRISNAQIKDGYNKGCWYGETNLTGSLVAGLVSAYELSCNIDYLRSAELGGDYIHWSAQGNFFGDEMYAITCLSQASADPDNNPWRTIVFDFYENVRNSTEGTEVYVSNYLGIDASTAVFYLANHVLASYYVDAVDKHLWRQGLIDFLSRVDDSCYYPVMSLGAATWALAQTGPLDKTYIHSSGEGASYWKLKKLTDLPDLLLDHQVKEGRPGAGSFYWQFGHTDSSPYGYTEDAIFATRGLVAAYLANPDPNIGTAIDNARIALLNGISSDGEIWERLSQEGSIYYTYSGEMLQVLGELVIPGDLDLDGNINSLDYAILVNNWQNSCKEYCFCNGADLDRNGKVDYFDLKIFAVLWLNGVGH